MKHLILGGTRSGKSRYAEQLANDCNKELVYIATAEALDEEMQARIMHHQLSRKGNWKTVEEPLKLAEILRRETNENRCMLVDCLTLWLTNILLAGDDVFGQEKSAFLDVLPSLPGEIILVSNEVGLGVVAADPLTRKFVDEAGRLHQQLGQVCSSVTLVTAGLPLKLK